MYIVQHYESYLGMWWADSFKTIEQAEQFKKALEKANYKVKEIKKING